MSMLHLLECRMRQHFRTNGYVNKLAFGNRKCCFVVAVIISFIGFMEAGNSTHDHTVSMMESTVSALVASVVADESDGSRRSGSFIESLPLVPVVCDNHHLSESTGTSPDNKSDISDIKPYLKPRQFISKSDEGESKKPDTSDESLLDRKAAAIVSSPSSWANRFTSCFGEYRLANVAAVLRKLCNNFRLFRRPDYTQQNISLQVEKQSWFLLPSVITWNSIACKINREGQSLSVNKPCNVSDERRSAVRPSNFSFNDSSVNSGDAKIRWHADYRPRDNTWNVSKDRNVSLNSDPMPADRMNKDMSELKTLIVEATETHSATVIWLHSLGDSGKYFANEDGHGLDLPDVLAVPWCRFIFPTAADISVTLHGGVQQPAWFDVERLDERGVIQDDRGVIAAAELVMALVSNELRLGIPANRIVLAGFGQGGVVAVQAALMLEERVGGVVALSTWLGGNLEPAGNVKAGLPVLLCHGGADVFVPARIAREASETLKRLGLSALLKTYDMMGHAFCAQELLDIQTFLLQHIPQNMTQPELPTYLHSSVQELLHRTSGSLFGGPTERAEPRSLVLSHGTMEAYTLDRGAVAASFDLAAHSFFASLTPPGSRKAGYGLLVYPRKAAVQDTVQSNEPGAGVTASASPMHGSAESPGDAAAAALPSVSAPQALKQAGAVPEAQVGTAWGWSGCLCRRGWTRRWLCMGGDPHAEARDAASPSRPIATYLFSAEAERDTWLQIISRWQRSLQQSSTPSPVRPVGPELGSHVNSTALTWCGALFGWASWPLGCCIPVCRPRRALKSAGAGGVPQWENVVFSGGGIKGLVFPAALGAVADCYGPDGRGLGWIKGVAGVSAGIALYNLLGGSMNISAPWVSAGSVVATLVACGCKVDEIKASAATLNLMHLSAGMSTLQGVRNMLHTYGVYDGQHIAEMVDGLIYRHTGLRHATFQDLHDLSGKVIAQER